MLISSLVCIESAEQQIKMVSFAKVAVITAGSESVAEYHTRLVLYQWAASTRRNLRFITEIHLRTADLNFMLHFTTRLHLHAADSPLSHTYKFLPLSSFLHIWSDIFQDNYEGNSKDINLALQRPDGLPLTGNIDDVLPNMPVIR